MAEDDSCAVLTLVDPPRSESPGEIESRIEGVALGRVVALPAPECAVVHLDEGSPILEARARALVRLTIADLGCRVALMFENGDPTRPVIIGRIEQRVSGGSGGSGPQSAPDEREPIVLDAPSIVVQAQEAITFRCGEATITLQKDGRILIRGAYVETRSQGVNRIKGAAVQIN